jgi:hypothetical protein
MGVLKARVDGVWVEVVYGAGGDLGMMMSQTWEWGAVGDPPMSSGQVAVNTEPGVLISTVYLADHDLLGVDWSLTIAGLTVGDFITLQYVADAGSWHRFQLTETPTKDGETWTFYVISEDGSPAGSAPPVGSSILVSFEATGPTSGAQSYTFVQAVPSDVWTINHGLSFNPNITITDSAGESVEGEVDYQPGGVVVVTFSAAFAGSAFLS